MPAIDYDSRVHVTRVVDRCELAAGVILLGLDAPELVRATRPGQFVMAIPPTGESAATALGIYEAEGARASLLFFSRASARANSPHCARASGSTSSGR